MMCRRTTSESSIESKINFESDLDAFVLSHIDKPLDRQRIGLGVLIEHDYSYSFEGRGRTCDRGKCEFVTPSFLLNFRHHYHRIHHLAVFPLFYACYYIAANALPLCSSLRISFGS